MISCQHAAAQSPAKPGNITTVSGVVFSGDISSRSKVTKVTSSLTDVYLTKAAIDKTEYDIPSEPLEIYEFPQPESKTKKKGTIGLVVKNWKMKVARNGTASVSLLDRKLGQVSFTAPLTKMTPTSLHWSGLEYSYEFSFPVENHQHTLQLITATVDKSKPDTALRAARFMRQAKQSDIAMRILALLPKGNPDRKAALQAIKRDTAIKRLEEIRVLKYRGAIADAAKRINKTVRAIAANDDLVWLDELSKLAKSLASAPRPDLPDQARLRLLQLDQLNQAAIASLTEDETKTLAQRWAQSMADQAWTVEQFQEGISLSQDLAIQMKSESNQGLSALARRFESSKLPRELLLDIVRYTPASLPQPRKWHRVDYVEPVSKKEFHYYASVPANAGPLDQLPVLVCMHGMNTKADVMYTYWGRWAERHGYVIVSPEYIYGREFGFRYSEEEVHSINGAITHALRTLPIDSNKVYLQGHSQGGHTAWEIGGALSGRLTGVVPLLGATRHTSYLSNYRHTAVYAIDGSEDGGAPELTVKTIKQMAKLDIDAIYVEYIGRAHESFYEEYDRALAWARPRTRDYGDMVELQASRASDFRRRWVRIDSTMRSLPTQNRSSDPAASVRAEKRGDKIRIVTKNIRGLALLTPVEWLDTKGKLRVSVNNKNAASFTPTLDWNYLLNEAHRTGDRTRLYCGETNIR